MGSTKRPFVYIWVTIIALGLGACTTEIVKGGPGSANPDPIATPVAQPWCEVANPLDWRDIGKASIEGGDIYSTGFRWHARHEREFAGRYTASVLLDDGNWIKPFDTPEGWSVNQLVFTESFLVALVSSGHVLEMDFKIWAWDPTNPDQSAWLVHERQPNSFQNGFITLSSHSDLLTWLEPGPSGDRQSLPIYNLRTRELTLAVTDVPATSPTWNGETLVWQQWTGNQSEQGYFAGIQVDGTPWIPPEQLAMVISPMRFSVEDDTWAWVDKDWKKLYLWKPGWETPQLVDQAFGEGHNIEAVAVTKDFLFYRAHDRQTAWVADIQIQTRAPLTDAVGLARVMSPGLVRMFYVDEFVIERYGARERYWETSELPRLAPCRD